MQKTYSMINGQLILDDQAAISIHDLSIVRGYGVFDYFKTVNNTPIFLEDNLDRFYKSASLMDLSLIFSRAELKSQIQILKDANNIPDAGIKLLLTGGISSDGYSIASPNLIITQQELSRNSKLENEGVKLITFDYHRPFSAVKSIDYVMGIQALKKAKTAGANDVVYTKNGFVSECPRANIFFINEQDTLLTPDGDVLEGITRKHIIEIAKKHMKVELRNVSTEEMLQAKESFITSTTKNITPVLAINNHAYGTQPGKTTRFLQKLLNQKIYEQSS